jgi:hypothetical protein
MSMIDINCLYISKGVMIFAGNVSCREKYEDIYGRVRFERIENTIIDIHFWEFHLLSFEPYFFTELSYIKSVLQSFLHKQMGSMSKSNPDSLDKFRVGDMMRGSLSFRKITKDEKKEQFLLIEHNVPKIRHKGKDAPPRLYEGQSVSYDYQEALMLDLCIGKAMNMFESKSVHPKNKKVFNDNWNVDDWVKAYYTDYFPITELPFSLR